MSQTNTDNRTASQKIEDLEKVVTVLYQAATENKNAIESLLRSQSDQAILSAALKLLNKKVEAIVQAATPETGITFSAISALVTQMNVVELVEQVAGFVRDGYLAPAEVVTDNTYLVCSESNAEGEVVNPRIQFRLDSQDQAMQDALKGKKAGDSFSIGESTFSVKVLEIYTLTEPKAPESSQEAPAAEAPAAEATPAEAQSDAPEAPAAEAAPAESATA